MKQTTLTEPPTPQLYQPMAQTPGIFSSVVARTTGDPMVHADELRAAIWSVDRDQPVWKVRWVEIMGLMLGRGMRVAVATVLGVLASMAASRLIESRLFGVTASDPVTFILVPLGLASVALLACYLPARRAARVDPMVALRSE